MSKKTKTQWYVNGDDADLDFKNELAMSRKDSCNTDKSTSLEGLDDADGWLGELLSPKTKLTEEQIQHKVNKYNLLIEHQLRTKEDNVTTYLEETRQDVDRHQLNKLKTSFEKTNQKCSQHIERLRHKKDAYVKRLSQMKANHQGSPQTNRLLLAHRPSLPVTIAPTKDQILKLKSTSASPQNSSDLYRSADDVAAKASQVHRKNSDFLPKKLPLHLLGLPNLLIPGFRSKSAADLSPRAESKEFTTRKIPGPDEAPSPAVDPDEDKIDSKEFRFAKRQLKELVGNNQQLSSSIKSLQSKLDVVHHKGRVLSEWQTKRNRLQKEMFDLIEHQQHEINSIKKELYGLEEKIGLKIYERGREIQEALESCQYQLFQLEHASSSHHLDGDHGNATATDTVGQFVIKAADHILTLIAAVFVVMATAASSMRDYQMNATQLQKIRAALVAGCIVAACIVLWKFVLNPGKNRDEL